MATVPANLITKADALVASLKTVVSAEKVPLEQAWKFIQVALAKLVLLIEQEAADQLANPEKKAVAMQYAQQIIKLVISTVSVPGLPAWLDTFLAGWLSQLLTQLASGSIDAIVTTFQSAGVMGTAQAVTTPAATTK